MNAIEKLDRRSFLKTGAAAAGGLLLGFYLPEVKFTRGQKRSGEAERFRAGRHGRHGHSRTSTSRNGAGHRDFALELLAEELECDWKKIRTEFPGVDPVAFGQMQGVFGSMSIRTSWEPLRKAGATAARDAGAGGGAAVEGPKSQCRAENNTVVNHRHESTADVRQPGRSRVEAAGAATASR